MAAIVISNTIEKTIAAIIVPALSLVCGAVDVAVDVASDNKHNISHRLGRLIVTVGLGLLTCTRAICSNTSKFNSTRISLQLKYSQISSTPKSTEILKHSVWDGFVEFTEKSRLSALSLTSCVRSEDAQRNGITIITKTVGLSYLLFCSLSHL